MIKTLYRAVAVNRNGVKAKFIFKCDNWSYADVTAQLRLGKLIDMGRLDDGLWHIHSVEPAAHPKERS